METKKYEHLDKLRDEIEDAKLQKEQTEHQLKRKENQLSYRESFSRKERTHHLIVVGAIVEQYFPEVRNISEADLSNLFKNMNLEILHNEISAVMNRKEGC